MKLPFFRRQHRCANSRRNHATQNVLARLATEPLEPRHLLAADPIITEFQAVNESTLTDEDGDTPDWIELHNPDAAAISLDGWFLTDDATELGKWKFPNGVQLEAGGYLVVFASGKNRTEPDSNLHTNFRLSSGGEYLGIVKPDGATVPQAFDPYPAQTADVSYGLAPGRETIKLIDRSAPIRARVPVDDSLGIEWTTETFNDASWLSGTSGIGYETLESGFSVTDSFDAPLSGDWTVDNPGASSVEVVDGNLVISVPTSANGQLATSEDRGLAPMVVRDVPRYQTTGKTPTTWEISTNVTQNNDDRGDVGFAILDGDTNLPILKLQYQRRSSFQLEANDDRIDRFRESGEDAYSLRLVRDELGANWSAFFKLPDDPNWTRIGSAKDGVDVPVIHNPRIALIAEASSSSTMNAVFDSVEIVASDELPTYESEIGLNIAAEMRDQNSSVYVRTPFQLEGVPSELDELSLTARFDDGFRAYLNGELIAEENAPFAPPPPAPNVLPWNAEAQGARGDGAGFIPSTNIDLTPHISKLNTGQNVLAVQGLNVSSNDRDFFFDAKLLGSQFVAVSEQSFVNPTPASQNLAPAAPEPTIIGEQGIFFDSTTIAIEIPEEAPGLEIRYTTDGSDPTVDSPTYTRPLILTETTMLQAKVFDTSESPIDPSPAVAGTFIAVNNSLKDRDSDIPIILLDTLSSRLIPDGSNALTAANVIAFEVDGDTGRAQIGQNVDYLGRGGVRDRGSSTANQAKPNMTFETWGADGNGADDDANVSLLGFSPESDWVLHAPFNYDRAMIRNQFAYGISNEIGRWAPGTRAVEVYLNRADGIVSESDYMGVYVLIEKIKPGPGRLDIEGIDNSDNAEPNISGGYIWKDDRPDPDAREFRAGGQMLNWVHPKSPDSRSARDDQKATPEQVEWVQNYFGEMASSMRNGDINDPEGYSKYIDVDSWIDHHIMGTFMDDVDAFVLSAYLFKDRDGKVEMGPNWDFDRSMESLDDRDDDPLRWGGSGDSNFFSRTWFGQLFRDEGFWQRYVDRWTEFRKTHLSLDNIDSLIDRLAGEIEEAQERNYAATVNRGVRPRRTSRYESGKLDGTWQGEVEHMRAWLHERVRFFDSSFTQPPLFTINNEFIPTVDPVTKNITRGIHVGQGTNVEIRSPIVDVYNDTSFIDGTVGVTPVRYFSPADESLEDAWFAKDFDDSAWSTGTSGIGFKSNDDFDEFFGTVVEPADGGTTIYTRFEFDVNDLSVLDDRLLTLQLRFDDGVVAYLNGEEILREHIRDDDLAWDSRASTRRTSDAIEFEDYDVSEFKSLLTPGKNVLAIRLVNSSKTNSDMLLVPALVAREVLVDHNPDAQLFYTTDGTDPRGPDGMPSATAVKLATGDLINVTQSTRIIARNLDDVTDRGDEARIVETNWSGTIQYDFTVGEHGVEISEINYAPAAATDIESAAGFKTEDFEFIELHNASAQPADLLGLHLQNAVEFDFFYASDRVVDAGQYALLVANKDAFEMRYGADLPVIGEYSGRLNNNGESLTLVRSDGTTFVSIDYQDSDPWPRRADGFGATLQLKTERVNAQHEALGKWYNWEASSNVGGTPGGAGQSQVGIAISEVLANTRGLNNVSDAIELSNLSDTPVDIGGWFLSDSANDYFQFQIPDGTTVAPGQLITFEESTLGFALSASGDSVWLTAQGADGEVETFVDDVHFGATPNGVSLGKVALGGERLVPLTTRSIGQPNGPASVGSVVISELHYNPTVSDAALAIAPDMSSSDLEFIEVHNTSDQSVDISGWRLRGGVDFEFPSESLLAGHGVAVILKFDPQRPINAQRLAAFNEQYDIPNGAILQGGYSGTLRNQGELIQLRRPEALDPAAPDDLSYLLVDEVLYDDLAPWPTAANGAGQSLQRHDNAISGIFPTAFVASVPNPGAIDGVLLGDFDSNGQLDISDVNLLLTELRADNPDARFDISGDGSVNGDDRDFLIESLMGSSYGDANLDGIFDSNDLVLIFQAGEYEDDIAGNSTWETGDWNGDGDFTTLDLVFAFRSSKYVAE